MSLPKGRTNNPNGRPAGIPNRTTTEFKEALNRLLTHAAPQMVSWLDRIAETNPEKAIDAVGKLAEYVHPKLARQELVGDKDNPLHINHTVTASDEEIIKRYAQARGEPNAPNTKPE